VQALFDTRSAWDVLLTVADELGDPVRQALAWPTFKDLLQDQLDSLRPSGTNQGQFWSGLLQRGGYWNLSAPSSAAPASDASPPTVTLPEAQFAGDPQTYPFVLVPFVHNTLGAGESAHLPWLQAAPDPVTSVTWQTWVELNPTLAAKLGVVEGDLVGVESARGRVEAPVYISPAAPPEILAMPFGQGHTGFGRWATGRGINPMQLLEPLADAASGALAYSSTRVKLDKTGRHVALPKLEGMAPARQLPGQEVLQVIRQ
jgi:menaquinone reductase, molybdopterin-binding-like subunit